MTTNTLRPIFQPNGDGYNMTLTGVLLMAAGALYGDPDETTPKGRKNAQTIVDGFLNAAFKGGFFQGDVLHTLLARNQTDRRTAELAQAACDAAGNDALLAIMAKAGF